jgi:DNA polymerase IV
MLARNDTNLPLVIAWGYNREIRADRVRKSVGAENTFSTDLTEFDAMVAELRPLVDKVWRHCEDEGHGAGRWPLRWSSTTSRSSRAAGRSPPASTDSDLECLSVALLQNEMPLSKPVRLLGVSLSALQGDDQAEPQLGLPI